MNMRLLAIGFLVLYIILIPALIVNVIWILITGKANVIETEGGCDD